MNAFASQVLRATAFAVLVLAPVSRAESEVPASSLTSWAEALKSDFASILEIKTIKLDDEPMGPSDWIVSGWGHKHSGLRVEVFRDGRQRLVKRWDSAPFTRSVEFRVEGRPEIRVWGDRQHEYGILIDGCAPHRCGGDVAGFLWYSGKAGLAGKALVTGNGLDKPPGSETYQIEFSPAMDANLKLELQAAICSSKAIPNSSGLPFTCKTP